MIDRNEALIGNILSRKGWPMAVKRRGKGTRSKGKKDTEQIRSLDKFIVSEPEEQEQMKDVSGSNKEEQSTGSNNDDIECSTENELKQVPGKSDTNSKTRSSNLSLIERSERRRTVEDPTKEPCVSGIELKKRIPVTLPGSSYDIPGVDIKAEEAGSYLAELRSFVTKKREIVLYFHNDMDGLNGALLMNRMITEWSLKDLIIHASPLEYTELNLIEPDENICYIFIDMDTTMKGDNVFRIDHHAEERNIKVLDKRTFLLSPPEKDYDYPSSATALCGYLTYISGGGDLSFFEYLGKGTWHKDPYSRLLILLASVCDNLWHLNFLIDIPMKRWVPDPEEEKYLVLVSISASIILGDDDKRNDLVTSFFKPEVTPDDYLGALCGAITGAQNVLDFADTVSKEAEAFYNRIFFNLTDSIDKTLSDWERDKKLWKELDDSMPIDMKGNREKMKELLSTKGDLREEHWRRIEFYGKELDNLEAKIKVEERKLLRLRAAKKMFSTEKGPRLCVVIPKQSSKQIKGIIASLLYYKGWKNIVIEERDSEAAWGARGFSKETINGYFSNLSLGYAELKDYLLLEKVYKDLPDVFRRTVNISKNISFYKTYEGGMGGRGYIYGGSLRGKVPWMFSLLEESGALEEKVKELIEHKELGNALQGLTEGQSNVSTAQALRAKFKSTGWLVVSPIPGKDGADILLGNFKLGILHLVGYNERFQIGLQFQEPVVHMDHGRFDVAD